MSVAARRSIADEGAALPGPAQNPGRRFRATPPRGVYNRTPVLKRLRSSLVVKLLLASAIPSLLVLLAGLGVLIAHTQAIARTDPALAFTQLRRGALLGTLLSLTFAGIVTAIAARLFLLKPVQALRQVMGRAELGDFLVRARVTSEDELGRLARSFNTMLARVTDMAVERIETRQSIEQMEREIRMQDELKSLNQQLEAYIGEMELLLEVTKAVSGSLDLPEQLDTLGRQICARLAIDEFSVLLIDEGTHQLVIEAVAGKAPAGARGMRFHLGEGITGEVAAQGKTIYVPDVEKDARFLHYKSQRRSSGSFLAVPLRAKGRMVGVMNLSRARVDAFTPQEVRLTEALAAQAALSIANARLYHQTLELSYTDALTGVANRRQLFLRLEQELSRSLRFGDELSLLMVDLDLFKAINDRHGHPVGDGVLRGVALLLKRNVRKVDLVARYGGEEFCVVLPRIARAEAADVAEKLRRAVASSPLAAAPSGDPLSCTISIGIATYGTDATDLAGLIEKADVALYEAKKAGRNRVVLATPLARAAG
jgi:diguanylate cyclase (GGDEF)-like protein